MDKNISEEEIKKIVKQLFIKSGLNNVGRMGDLYHIGEGCYTDKEGWRNFLKALNEELVKTFIKAV